MGVGDAHPGTGDGGQSISSINHGCREFDPSAYRVNDVVDLTASHGLIEDPDLVAVHIFDSGSIEEAVFGEVGMGRTALAEVDLGAIGQGQDRRVGVDIQKPVVLGDVA